MKLARQGRPVSGAGPNSKVLFGALRALRRYYRAKARAHCRQRQLLSNAWLNVIQDRLECSIVRL